MTFDVEQVSLPRIKVVLKYIEAFEAVALHMSAVLVVMMVVLCLEIVS